MSKIKLDKNSKYISNINVDLTKIVIDNMELCKSSEEISVGIKINSTEYLDELEKINLILVKKFNRQPTYSLTFNNFSNKNIVECTINFCKWKSAIFSMILSDYSIKIDDKKIYIYIQKHHLTKIDESGFKIYINNLLKVSCPSLVLEILGSEKEIDLETELKKVEVEIEKNRPTNSVSSFKETKRILGADFNNKPFKVAKIDEAEIGSNVVLEGRVFNLNIIKRPTITIVSFNIDMKKNAFNVKFFTRQGNKIDISDNTIVRIRGKKELDSYNNNEVSILAKDIMYIREDKTEKINTDKRVELHVHTKMSEMDSIIDIDNLMDKVESFGYNSVAITDGGVVYGFPAAYRAAKKRGIKPIFGMEGYIVDNILPMVYKAKDIDLKDETFVVFDIETTGFNPYRDKIIEIGAVKVINGEKIGEFKAFIDPEIKIPIETTEITGITDDMVKGAEKIDSVLKDFLAFAKDHTLVAHNANFDMGFIRQKALDLGIVFDNSYIDTVSWARSILSGNKKHGLKDLAKHYDLELRHHRAYDDAFATAKIFEKLSKEAINHGTNLKDIAKNMKRNILATFPNNILIYAKNEKGLKELYDIVSNSHLESFRRKPKIAKSYISEKRENLFIGLSFNSSEIVECYSRGGSQEMIKNIISFYDFIEISPIDTSSMLDDRLKREDIEKYIKFLVKLGRERNIDVIATSNARYLEEEDARYIKPLLYGKGNKTFARDKKQYIRTSEDLIENFMFLGKDIAKQVVIDNSISFAEKIENTKPVPEGFYPPVIEGTDEEIRKMTYSKAHKIYGDKLPEEIEARIERELNAIIDNGFSILYLISHKLVNKSLKDGYLVGSRGSVGSSLVAWLMDITEVNALHPHYICTECKNIILTSEKGSGVDLEDKECCNKVMIKEGHSIPFEIFMGFKGEKIPDIDLNFSGIYQPEVHKYVEELFGKENVFRAGTISTLAKRNAFGYIRKYFEENSIEGTKAYMELFSSKCENVRKTTGQHPGGVIIVPKDQSIFNFTPIQKPANDVKSEVRTTHFDYHVMDKQLVKLDILGHDDPTTLKFLEEYTGVNATSIPLDDEKTLSLFNSTNSLGVSEEELGSDVGTFGIPEFGTPFARKMLSDTKPSQFADLIRISGLSHGIDVWSNNAQNLIKGEIATLSEVISVRDDIMNYLISKGIEKEKAFGIMEFVRKGLPLKKPKDWEKHKSEMLSKEVPKWYIDSCEKITYMFPKGHAAAYVLMAVRIAYFKVHHPAAFYAAYLTRKADFFDITWSLRYSTDKLRDKIKEYQSKSRLDVREKNELYVLEIILEMRLRNIDILPIDLYSSESTKFLVEEDKIRMPFIVLKGLGELAANSVINEREIPFKSFEDLRKRTKVSKTICEQIKELNLFDLQDLNQKQLF